MKTAYIATCCRCGTLASDNWLPTSEAAIHRALARGWTCQKQTLLCPGCQRPSLDLPEPSTWWQGVGDSEESKRFLAVPVYEAALRHALGAVLRPADYNHADVAAMITKALAVGGKTP